MPKTDVSGLLFSYKSELNTKMSTEKEKFLQKNLDIYLGACIEAMIIIIII